MQAEREVPVVPEQVEPHNTKQRRRGNLIRKKHITLCFSLFLALSMVLGQLIPVAATDEIPAEEPQAEQTVPAAEEPAAEPEPEVTTEEEPGVVPIEGTDPVQDEQPADEGQAPAEPGEAADPVQDGEEAKPEEEEQEETFTASKDGASVKVVARNAQFPEGTFLEVKELTKESEDPEVAGKYREAEEKVGSGLGENESFIAYDLSFKNPAGEEVEPAQDAEVDVTLTIQRDKFPENLKEDSIEIQHLEETDGGIEVKPVASANDTVTVRDAVVESQFAVESFSTFTATFAKAKAALPESLNITLEDKVTQNGRIEAKVGGIPEGAKTTYTWYKDGVEVARVANGIESGENIYTIDRDPEKASWVNAVAAKGLQSTYQVKVTVDIDGETKEYQSDSKKIEYYDSIRNGDFGTPKFNDYSSDWWGNRGTAQKNVSGGSDVIWKTTDDDNNIELVGTHKDNTTHYKGTDADENYQWAELNAERPGSLYQDVITLPGTTLNWSFAHRARGDSPNRPNENTKDTMYLLITSTKVAGENNLTNQASVEEFIAKVKANPTAYPGVTVYTATDDNTKWSVHSGGYTVPDKQYQTRFYFVAGPTASKKQNADTIGNYIDAVSFGSEIPVPVPEKSTLYIYKDFGADSEITIQDFKTNTRPDASYNALKFRIQYGNVDKTIDVPVYDSNSPVYIEQLDYQGEVTITEVYGDNSTNQGSKIEGYDLTTKSWIGDGGEDASAVTNQERSITATLAREQNTIVHFENTYKQEATTFKLSNNVEGLGANLQDPFEFLIQLTKDGQPYTKDLVHGDNTYTYDETRQGHVVSLKHGESIEPSIPKNLNVKITQTEKTGYTTTHGLDTATQNGLVHDHTNDVLDGHHITFLNTLKQSELTVVKQVTGNFGDKSKSFAFEIQLTNPDESPVTAEITGLTKGDMAGLYTFSLTDGKNIKLTLPYGATYKVIESSETAAGYQISYVVDGADAVSGSEYSGTLTTASTVTFINHKQGEVPSGLGDRNNSIYGLLFSAGTALILVGAIVMIRRRMNAI